MRNKTIALLENLSVATVTMQLLKKGIRNSAMKGVSPLNFPVKKIVGPAYTLRFIPAREDLSSLEILANKDYAPRLAIEETPKNAVLVIDGRGESNLAVLGDIIIERLKVRGVRGIVTDGGVRDLKACISAEFPIYAAGAAAPASITGHASGGLNCPIGCGGVAVIPGDIIVADSDGAAVIPLHLAEQVALDGTEQERFEEFAKIKIQSGSPIIGTYPPNNKTRIAYEAWIKSK